MQMVKQDVLRIQTDGYRYMAVLPQVLGVIDFAVEAGEVACIMGPNGCGKSTLLLLCAGELESQDVRRSCSVPDREIAVVYQDYRQSLFPWKTAYDNIWLPTLIRGCLPSDIQDRTNRLLQPFGVDIDMGALPATLSGGEQQKLCVLRSLLQSPKLLLMDEPCSAMDYASRLRFLKELRRSLKESGTSVVMISHSAEDALLLCDRLHLMSDEGKIVSVLSECQDAQRYGSNIEAIHQHFRA